MSAVLFVRVGSEVERTKLERRVLEKKPSFLEVPGLIQKIYDRDPETGIFFLFNFVIVLFHLLNFCEPLREICENSGSCGSFTAIR